MLKTIENPNLYQRLKGKFAWSGNAPAPVLMENIVQPVTLIDDCLKWVDILYGSFSVIADASITLFTVPDDERWHVNSAYAYHVTGTFNIEDIRCSMPGTYWIPLHDGGAVDELKTGVFGTPVIVDSAGLIGMSIHNYAAGGTVKMIIHVVKEKIS